MTRFICDICGAAASTVFCHTDSTSLCSGCDDFIHAEANPMAGHHCRVPIQTTANPLPSLFYEEFSALNHCHAETAAAAREEFFYYGSDNGDCFDDLIAFNSSCSDDVLHSSSGSRQGIQQDYDNMNVPIMHSVEQDLSLKGSQLRIEDPEVRTFQASPLCTPPKFQTVSLSIYISAPGLEHICFFHLHHMRGDSNF